jgi:lysophospholipase L1-like esterase
MSQNVFGIIVGLVVLLTLAIGSAKEQSVRIMPLGDSITQGFRGHDSFRRGLWLRLKKAGARVDFVGSLKENFGGMPHHTDFDMDHEGHWGWRADQVLARVDNWAAKNVPDIVLLHLGTNDIGGGQDIEETVGEIEEIIMTIRKHNPKVKVLLAQIIPMANEAINERIKKFNEQLESLAESICTEESPVILVNHFDGFDSQSDTYDGVHPNEWGADKMADKWYEALDSLLSIKRGEREARDQ